MNCDCLWGHLWAAVSGLGSVAASCVSLWLALRRPKEHIIGEWEPMPIGVCEPMAMFIRLRNNGRYNVDLPDVLRIEFYMADSHWGTAKTDACNNNFIPAKFYGYETTVELPDEQLKAAISDADMRIFTWTKAGTRIELKRCDTKIENLGI